MTGLNLPPVIAQDPRVQKAAENLDSGKFEDAAAAALLRQEIGVEKYGLKLRKNHLLFQVVLIQFLRLTSFEDVEQGFVMLWMLAAPMTDVYAALETLRKGDGGKPALMATIFTWYESCGLPTNASAELVDDVAETFSLITKLNEHFGMTSADSSMELKKNSPTG